MFFVHSASSLKFASKPSSTTTIDPDASNSFCQQDHQSSHPLVTKGAGLPTTTLLNVVIAVGVIAIHQSVLSIWMLTVLLAPIPHV